MNHQSRPLNDIEQGMLFLWLRTNVPPVEIGVMRVQMPEIAHNIFGPPMIHGIPEQLFMTLQAMVSGNRSIEAIRELRAHMGWSLKDAKDFIDKHCK